MRGGGCKSGAFEYRGAPLGWCCQRMDHEIKAHEPRKVAYSRRAAVSLSETHEQLAVRFTATARREIRRLMRTSARLADLANVFPGAIFALATRRGAPARRLEAISLIESGAPLKSVARALELPMWMRKLPPEAFARLSSELPGGETFTRRIATRMPASAAHAAAWLNAVSFAHRAAHEDFAVWIAEQSFFHEDSEAADLLSVMAAYAWHSSKPASPAHALIVVPWRPEIGFDTALCAAKSWLNRIRLVLQLAPGALTDPWLTPGEAHGFTFTPLLTHADILAEAQAMQNCADQYADRLVREKCRLFSVKLRGQRIATLEIGPHQRETSMLAVNQLKARHNMAASSDVWRAAYGWVAGQNSLRRLPQNTPPAGTFDQSAWHRLMLDYRTSHHGAPWFETEATHFLFASLDASLCELARRAGVSSWLFT